MSVLVFADSSEGKFKKAAFEVVSYGKKVAEQLSTTVVAVTINAENPSELASYGADKIITITDEQLKTFNAKAYANTLKQVAEKENATIVVIDSGADGLYLAPLVATYFEAGYASNVVAAPSTTSPLTVKRKAFSNKGFNNTEIKSAKAVLGLAKNSFGIIESAGAGAEEGFSPSLDDADFKVSSIAIEKASGKVTIADADIVVSAGRGLKGLKIGE